jgi:hypothetical protein
MGSLDFLWLALPHLRIGDTKMFTITQGKGFQVAFANGNVVSVQWGSMNYCDPTHKDGRNAPYDAAIGAHTWSATTAEVAAWNKEGEWHNFGGDQVNGWMSPEEVLEFLNFAANNELDTTDPFAWSDDEDEASDGLKETASA